MLTVVAGEGEQSRMAAAGFHSATETQPSASYLPRHSPILNLSPNLSPESQSDSASPVFELLDSNRRRTVQGKCTCCISTGYKVIRFCSHFI